MKGYRRKTIARQRRVWAFLTARPDASVRDVAEHLRLPLTNAWGVLRGLERTGYIRRDGTRAWEVIVPCFTDWRIVPAPAHPGVNATEAR